MSVVFGRNTHLHEKLGKSKRWSAVYELLRGLEQPQKIVVRKGEAEKHAMLLNLVVYRKLGYVFKHLDVLFEAIEKPQWTEGTVWIVRVRINAVIEVFITFCDGLVADAGIVHEPLF